MTHTTLQSNFWALLTIENVFERYLMLLEMEADYKTTIFYKTTRMKIIDAFDFFMRQMGNTVAAINVLSSEDLTKLTNNFGIDKLMGSLKEEDRDFIKELVDIEQFKTIELVD